MTSGQVNSWWDGRDVPIFVEIDEDGMWCAHARLRPGLGAHGEGETLDAALGDLEEALAGLLEEFSAG